MTSPLVLFWNANPVLKQFFGNEHSFLTWLGFNKSLKKMIIEKKKTALELIIQARTEGLKKKKKKTENFKTFFYSNNPRLSSYFTTANAFNNWVTGRNKLLKLIASNNEGGLNAVIEERMLGLKKKVRHYKIKKMV